MNIIEQITQHVHELMKIRDSLGDDKAKPVPPIPTMHPDELPEKYVLVISNNNRILIRKSSFANIC